MICNEEFGILTRRHHCRRCGWVVCASCSEHRLVLDRWLEPDKPHALREGRRSDEPLRVCDMCHRVLRGGAMAPSDTTAGVGHVPQGQEDFGPQSEPEFEPEPEPAGEFAAQAVADYDGTVSARMDEMVTVLDGSRSDMWVIRRANGEQGAVPASVFGVGQAPAPAPAPAGTGTA